MGLYINDDFCGFWLSGFGNMNRDGLKKQIDFYTEKGGVTAILFNMNAQRAYFASKVWDCAWKDVSDDAQGRLFFGGLEVLNYTPEPPLLDMVRNSREMAKNVPDIFEFRYRYCHEKGVEMWHSMRMDDTHWVPNPEYVQHSTFWRENPGFRRAAYRKTLSSVWNDQALDYLHAEVRAYELSLIAEYLSHECDGIELDFLRDCPVFRPGGGEEGRPLLTQMMRDIRREADRCAEKFGHRVRIMVRVPPDPNDCVLLGLDVKTWAEEGLCDIVTPSAVSPGGSRPDIPVAIWRMILPERIELAAGIEIGMHSGYAGGNLRSGMATDAGYAATFYYRGADSIYFYNHFYSGAGYTERELQKITYSFIGDRAKTEAQFRRHVAAAGGSCVPGRTESRPFHPLAWKKSGIYNEIDAGGGTAGRTGYVVIGSNTEIKAADIRLNTVLCERVEVPADLELPKSLFCACFRAPDGVLHDGMNGIDVINQSVEADFELHWVELDVR